MAPRRRFALALVVCIAAGVSALVLSIVSWNRGGLPIEELLLVEPVPADASTPSGDQLAFVAGLFDGTRRMTAQDSADRLGQDFAADFPPDVFNEITDSLVADTGGIRFVRIRTSDPEGVRILGVRGNGDPVDTWVQFDADGRIIGLTLPPGQSSPHRLPATELAMLLLAGWVLIGSAAAAWRFGAAAEAWMLLGAAITTHTATAVLVDVEAVYVVGRIAPSLVVVMAVTLLAQRLSGRARQLVTATAVAAGTVGILAAFARDSATIGHPAMPALIADDTTALRTLLASSAALTALAMFAVAVLTLRQSRAHASIHQIDWVAGTVAIIWALIATGKAADYSLGNGTLAGGPFQAATWSAVAAVAVVVNFRLISSKWDRPEVATLVIDLETDGADLNVAVAKALGDPSLLVLTSPDGVALTGPSGETVDADDLPDNRALTEIRSGTRLVGAFVHDPKLTGEQGRVAAVAAAAGLALEVGRLNQTVIAQLDEVSASRSRIVQASDTARRRIERDLHDGAQQRLVALGLRLQHARRLAGSETRERLETVLDDASAEVREILDDIRAVSRGARPALLAERGLGPAVDALAERAPVPVRIDITTEELPSDVQTTAYFVIAEGLTNVAKHAAAGHASVSVSKQNGCARIRIADDGHGGASPSAGSGLEGLNDRVAAAAGTLTIDSDASGTTLEVEMPCA